MAAEENFRLADFDHVGHVYYRMKSTQLKKVTKTLLPCMNVKFLFFILHVFLLASSYFLVLFLLGKPFFPPGLFVQLLNSLLLYTSPVQTRVFNHLL